MTTEATGIQVLENLAGKYLTFKLNNEVYGIPILQVQEIIGLLPITKVPRTPRHMRGVVNLRGKVIPIMDARARFGLAPQQDTERTCIVVVRILLNNLFLTVGLVVDEVCEVVYLDGAQIEPTPAFSTSRDSDFILAMGKAAKHVVMLLDMDRVLESAELAMAAN